MYSIQFLPEGAQEMRSGKTQDHVGRYRVEGVLERHFVSFGDAQILCVRDAAPKSCGTDDE